MTKNQQLLALAEGRAGLVLSGGGAKGAYQVGVVKCLVKHGVRLSAIAGTSVGALNGAVIAAAPDLDSAADRLEEIWRERLPTILGRELSSLYDLLKAFQELELSRELSSLYEEYMAPYEASLEAGLSLYVGVFRSRGKLVDLAWATAGLIGLSDTPEADFIQVQTLPRREYKEALLASAAYPLICATHSVEGQPYRDGGLGGMSNKQGHTPFAPLVHDAGCHAVIVIHNADGSPWDRHDFPDVAVLEIRPGSPIRRRGGLFDTFDFNAENIDALIEQGSQDAERCLASAAHALILRKEDHAAQARLDRAIQQLANQQLIDPDIRQRK